MTATEMTEALAEVRADIAKYGAKLATVTNAEEAARLLRSLDRAGKELIELLKR